MSALGRVGAAGILTAAFLIPAVTHAANEIQYAGSQNTPGLCSASFNDAYNATEACTKIMAACVLGAPGYSQGATQGNFVNPGATSGNLCTVIKNEQPPVNFQSTYSSLTARCSGVGTYTTNATALSCNADPAGQSFNGGLEITITGQATDKPCVLRNGKNQLLRQAPEPGGGISIAVISYNPAAVTGRFETAGQICQPGTSVGTAVAVITDADNNKCAASTSGTKVCIANKNCGTVNGEYKCLNTAPPENTCVQTETGRTVCARPIGAVIASPPFPDNGTPGVPATPQATIENDATQIDVYAPGTAYGDSTPSPPPTDDGKTNEAVCGAPPLPACNAKIDETGTPSNGPAGPVFDQDGIFSSITSAAGNNPSSGQTIPIVPFSSSSCTTISGSFLGKPVDVPGTSGCQRLTKLKEILGYAFYLLTAWFLARRAIGEV
ncbi:MAG: hypothetical protein AABY95_01550 [Pseudomonadota bacterium]